MDFGHLLQREWIVKPRTDFKGLDPYRLPDETLSRINGLDVVSAFVHHGCVLLSCYRGRWHKARYAHRVQDWFCSHVLALCTVLWCAANGKVWQRSSNPYHLYFEFNGSLKEKHAVQERDLDSKKTEVDEIGRLLVLAPTLTMDQFVVRLSYVILWRVDSVLSRDMQIGDVKVQCRLVYPRDYKNQLAKQMIRLWSAGRYALVNLQFTRCGSWQITTDSGIKEDVSLFTHYSACELLRFWGRSHDAELRRVATQYGQHHGEQKNCRELYIRGCFDGDVHPLDSCLQAMRMLMLSTGSPPDRLCKILLRTSTDVDSKSLDRASGTCSQSDVRRVILSGLFDNVKVSRVLNDPRIRYGLYAYARDASENQVNVVAGMRWKSLTMSEIQWSQIDAASRWSSGSKIDEVCIRMLTE
jgi:hypothetical protein